MSRSTPIPMTFGDWMGTGFLMIIASYLGAAFALDMNAREEGKTIDEVIIECQQDVTPSSVHRVLF